MMKNAEARNVVKPCGSDADCYRGITVPPGIRGWCDKGDCRYARVPPTASDDAHKLPY